MNIILFDDQKSRKQLLPLTFTRPVAELRVGILTIREKWEKRLKGIYSWQTEQYLSGKYPTKEGQDNYLINASVCPTDELAEAVQQLNRGSILMQNGKIIACHPDTEKLEIPVKNHIIEFEGEYIHIEYPWDIFSKNGLELERDYDLLTRGRTSAELSSTNTILGSRFFAEEGAQAECAVFNTLSGPVYLGKDTVVMEGSVVRGGLALCDHSQLKLSTKIYGPTTIGPYSKVGGEVNNSVILGYSNKGHDGFLGNSVLGEWCNIGADSNNSNLKNNYDEVKLWSYLSQRFEKTGLQFCGLIMGDHSKCGINTMFNTGTVVGVSANIFGSGFPRNFIPSYSWGGASGFTEYKLSKAMDTAGRVMQRRGVELDLKEKNILQHIFDLTASFR